MSGSYYSLNAKYNTLLALINGLTPSVPQNLSGVLALGNNAGTTDIDMNNNDILLVNNIDLATINGSAYPPVVGADALSDVLLIGNNAGTIDIDMNNNDILLVNNIDLVTINGSAYPPVIGADTLSAVLTAGNNAGASQIDMNSNKIINTTDPTNLQDVATKNYIDTILSGYMKQVKVERFTTNGNFVVPVGVTYAIAHIRAGGSGSGVVNGTIGSGGNSSVAFVSGTITAIGGIQPGRTGFLNAAVQSSAGAPNSGKGAFLLSGDGGGNNQCASTAPDGAEIVAGAPVAFGQTLAVVVGAGGTAGTNGAAGGSGYVYIEYY